MRCIEAKGLVLLTAALAGGWCSFAESDGELTARRTIVNCRPGECGWRHQKGWVRPDEITPGTMPFEAPKSVEFETSTNFPGSVELRLKGETSGTVFAFTSVWQRVTRIATPLPAGERYRLHDFRFHPKARHAFAPGEPGILRVDGFYAATAAAACELDVRTGHPLHIVRGEAERPVFLLKNAADRTLAWTGELRLADFLGHTRTIPFKARVAAGETHEIKLPGPLPEKGVWQVFGEIRGEDGSVASPKTRFAVLDDHGAPQRLSAGKFRMGVNYHVGRYFSVCRTNCNEALMACGAKLVRIALGNWRGAQPKSAKDAYDWTTADRTLAEMHAIGCDVNAGCWGMPHWAADPETREKATKEKDWKVWGMTPPKDTTALEAYYEAAARHFGTKIAYYEIGNEWDLPFFFPGTTEEAVRGLSAAGRALHKGCPDVRVTPCGWACAGDSKMVRNKGIQSNLLVRCKGAYDIHAIHLHGGFKDFRRRVLTGMFPLRKACGVTEPWYANETAVSVNHVGELPTAENVWMKILFSWAYGSTDYIWYNLRATGWDPKDSEQGYGMITPDFYPRASFAAFSALSKLLSGFDADGIVRSEADRECFRFKGERAGVPERVLAGWETAPKNKTRPVRVKTDAQRAFLVDLMGNAREVPVSDGVCVWPFGARPSALRLVGATKAEPVAEDVDAKNLPPKVIKVGCGKGRPADLTSAGADDVHNFFEANPGMVHRLWKGPDDCSFRAWFDKTDAKTLTVTVEVTDDVHTQHAEKTAQMSQGDCVRLDFEAKGQTGTWFLGFRRTDEGASEPHVWYAANGFDGDKVRKEIRFESDRKGAVTTYRVALPIEAMGLGPDPFDGHVKASVKVDDADGDDRDLWMGLDGCWTLQGACADECPRWITIMPLPEQNAAAVAEDAVALGNETLVNGIAYMCNLTPEGDPAADRAAIYAKRYREVAPLVRKASKVKQGVLLQATMGHGYRPGQPTPWQTCVKPNGDSVYRFCPLDPRFLDYVAAQCRTLSDLKPDFFMLDDDTRMVWSDELPGCFCPLHLAALEKRTGRKRTREEVIAGLKAKDEALARAWDEDKFDSLRTFYRTIRANITGTVPGMICVVTSPAHFKRAKEIAEILAAPGQTPTVRGGGAPYHHLGKDLYHVIGQRYAYSRQLAAVGEGVAYMMEADTCPQTLWSTSATREYNELVMMALEGVKGAKIWITRLGNPHEKRSQQVYRKAFAENRGIMEWSAKVDFRQQGVVIPLAGPVDKNFGDQYLSIMGFPYRFGTARAGEITALTAATVANLATADLERILSGRVLLDGGAAVALAKLGYGKDIGVEAAEWQSAPAQAHRFEDGFVQNGIGRGSLVDLNRHDAKAQVLTRILHRPHMGAELTPVDPGSLLFENARGGRVLTLAQTLPPQQAWYFESDMQSETYKTQVARWLRRLADGVPGGVFYRGDGPVMCEAGTTSAGESIVVLDVLDLDGVEKPELVFDKVPARIERLGGDGRWRDVAFESVGQGECRLSSPVFTQRPAVFRLAQ